MTPRSIRHALAAAVVGSLMALPAAATCNGDFSLEVLVDGRPLTEYAHRDTSYVEAQPRAEYALRLANRGPRRIAVALAVDGLNTIDASSTSAQKARKWVLDPWQTVVIEGWQVSGSTARRFVFTTEADSYGAWLGRTENLGVIEAVVFPERRPLPQPRIDGQGKAAGAPAAPGARDQASGRREAEGFAATGIGDEVDHHVVQVRLDLEPTPSARVRLRYEYRPELVRLGVLPRCDDGLARRERAHGFTDTGFCPDPRRSR
jgi:hypothetical protein